MLGLSLACSRIGAAPRTPTEALALGDTSILPSVLYLMSLA